MIESQNNIFFRISQVQVVRIILLESARVSHRHRSHRLSVGSSIVGFAYRPLLSDIELASGLDAIRFFFFFLLITYFTGKSLVD